MLTSWKKCNLKAGQSISIRVPIENIWHTQRRFFSEKTNKGMQYKQTQGGEGVSQYKVRVCRA